jgi:serine/threonine-protein kinase
MDELITNDSFSRYRILERISAGQVSFVYRGVHAQLGKPVAVKVLHPQFVHDTRVRERFLREGRAVARIRHPHVVDVSDVGSQDGVPYIVMEFLEGESLESLLRRKGALAVREAADLIIPVIDALRATHAAGVVHRDLRPANVLLVSAGVEEMRPTLVDFGLARVVDAVEGEALTQVSSVIGEPAYMAPEVALDARCAGPRSDQYGLGATLYEMVTGHAPIEGGSLQDRLRRARESAYETPRTHVPALPEAIEAVILRTMSRRAQSRFNTLDEMIDALLPFASERTRVMWGASPFDPIAPLSSTPPPRRASSHSSLRTPRAHAAGAGLTLRRPERPEQEPEAPEVPSEATPPIVSVSGSPELLAAFEPTISTMPTRTRGGVPIALAVMLVVAMTAIGLARRHGSTSIGRRTRHVDELADIVPPEDAAPVRPQVHVALPSVDAAPLPTVVASPEVQPLPPPRGETDVPVAEVSPSVVPQTPPTPRRRTVRRVTRVPPRPRCVSTPVVAVPLFEVDPSAGAVPVARRRCP